jgi:cystathionine gamma-lyase
MLDLLLALCYSSGMATITNLINLLTAGDHFISFDHIFGKTKELFQTSVAKFGFEISYVDATDPQNVVKALKPNTKMVWIETPNNPLMKLVDIKAVADIVKSQAPQAFLVVDNTFMSSYFQKPLLLGADIVMHSLTKYMNGLQYF